MKCEACRAFYLFFATSLINAIIQEQECSIVYIYHMTLKLLWETFLRKKLYFCHYVSNVVMDVITFLKFCKPREYLFLVHTSIYLNIVHK